MRIALAFVLVLFSVPALAQSAAKSPEYKQAISVGLQEFTHGNYPEARAAFERAHALAPSARTLRGMGLAAFESRDYVGAIELLTQALAHPAQPLSEGQRREAIDVITRAQGNVATLELELTPGTAALLVDGQPVAPQAGKVTLNPGPHRLEAHAAEHEPLALHIDAQPGRTTKHTLALRRAGYLLAGDGSSASHDAGRRSLGPYLLAGGGGLLLITAAITGALTASAENELRASCETGTCDEDVRDSGMTLQVTTNVLLPIGAVLLASGVVWWILDTPSERAQASRARLLAGCSGSGCSVEARGTF